MDPLLFDLDDTLIVDEAVSLSAMEATAALAAKRHGAEVPRFLADAKILSQSLWRDNPCQPYCNEIGITAEECLWGNFPGASLSSLRSWSHGFRRSLFDAVLREQNLPGDGESLAEVFATSRRKLQCLMPNARETLVGLKPHFKIGLLTNGDSDLQREKIAASGLARFFDAITVSGELGIGKPKPKIFHALLKELGAPPESATMVGNSLARDIAGAQAAGFARTVWLKVPGSEEYADASPDHTIHGLQELPAILGLTNICE
jgi:putative hydrolase of the HAD superfamily